jgi:hypothetical protein
LAYYMLGRDEPYRDLGPDWLRQRDDEAHARRLVSQRKRLGHTVLWIRRPDGWGDIGVTTPR